MLGGVRASPQRRAGLGEQGGRTRVQVVRRHPARVAEVPAGGSGVQVDDPRPADERQQVRGRAGVGERRAPELGQQLQIVLAGAAHRADDRREAGGEHRHQPAQPALDRQRVDDVG